jgi:cyclin B
LLKNTTRGSRKALGDITNRGSSTSQRGKKSESKTEFSLIEQYEAPYELPAPSDAQLQKEQEACDHYQRDIDNIDERDSNNPLSATEYVNDMYHNFTQLEKQYQVTDSYMHKRSSQVNPRMRTELIDWVANVHLRFRLSPETLYLAVSIVDRYLNEQASSLSRSNMRLMGAAAILIASKYEEIYPPEVQDLIHLTERAYTKPQVLEMEAGILEVLNYDITIPTAHTFLCRFLKAGHADRKMVQLSCYLCERMLQESTMLQHLPSLVAAASVFVTRTSLRRYPWSPTLVRYTGYSEQEVFEVAREVVDLIEGASPMVNNTIARKYSANKYGQVAKLPLECGLDEEEN